MNGMSAAKPIARISLKALVIMCGAEAAFGSPAPRDRAANDLTWVMKLFKVSAWLMLMMSSPRTFPKVRFLFTVEPDVLHFNLVAERLQVQESADFSTGG